MYEHTMCMYCTYIHVHTFLEILFPSWPQAALKNLEHNYAHAHVYTYRIYYV